MMLTHGFRIDQDQCTGCLTCMRACPTHAIRVKGGKAVYQPDRCIDCGACLTSCPLSAITATTWSFEDSYHFKFKVAVPSPVLFGQFPAGITPAHIVDSLLALGFDAVWDFAVDLSLINRAIQRYVESWKGPFPLISISCPVVVRLVQVSYPRMAEQLIHVQLPREIAGREAKRRYSEELGVPREEIGAIYITPCQAKTISILQPAEGGESDLDGSIAIADVYNAILTHASQRRNDAAKPTTRNLVRNAAMLDWSLSEGVGRNLPSYRCLNVTGLSNIIQVFDDIEKGKLRNVEYLEAHNCWSGCASGNLTVANVYVTLSKIHSMMRELPEMDAETLAEVERRFPSEDLSLHRPIRPRTVRGSTTDLRERVRLIHAAGAVLTELPGLDCGLCGAPTCKEMAKDIATGDAAKSECVFLSGERLQELQRTYLGGKK